MASHFSTTHHHLPPILLDPFQKAKALAAICLFLVHHKTLRNTLPSFVLNDTLPLPPATIHLHSLPWYGQASPFGGRNNDENIRRTLIKERAGVKPCLRRANYEWTATALPPLSSSSVGRLRCLLKVTPLRLRDWVAVIGGRSFAGHVHGCCCWTIVLAEKMEVTGHT